MTKIRTNLWLLPILFICTSASVEKKVVCYFGSWAIYRPGNGQFDFSAIDPTLCTHLVYTFIGMTQDANINLIDPWCHLPSGRNGFNLVNQLREKSPNTKTLIAIGGWNENPVTYSQVISDSKLRETLIENLVKFIKEWDFNGLDFDWEYPNQRGGVEADKKNYILLLKELRERFDEEGLLLTAAVAAAKTSASLSYIIPELSKYLDFINLMAYDLHGSWETKTGINAPLYPGSWETGDDLLLNVEACVNYWISEGAPPEKLVLGVPAYGRTFTLDDPNNNEIGASARSPGNQGPYTQLPGTLGYNEICEKQLKEKWEIRFEKEQRVPYAIKDRQWIGYDDVRSITEKAEFINKLNLGGAMVWSIETDDFKGICGEKYPLLNALNLVLRNNSSTVPTTVSSTTSTTGTVTPTSPTSSQTSTTTEKTSSTTSGSQQTYKCKTEGYFRDPYDPNCSIFYYCSEDDNGDFIRHDYTCPSGLAFDEKYFICNWKDQVDCNN